MGNALVEFTALLCEVLHAAGASFSVENPEMSWPWLLAPVRRLRMLCLRMLSGVVFSKVFFSDYLVPFMKPTLLLHNVVSWQRLGEQRFSWHGQLCRLRGIGFRTRLAQTYPPLLCVRLAELLHESWDTKPGARLDAGYRWPQEILQVEKIMAVPPSLGRFLAPFGLGAPIGLMPEQHVQFAMLVKHPCCARGFGTDLSAAFDASSDEIDEFRAKVLRQILSLAHDLRPEQAVWAQTAPDPLKGLVSHIHGSLWVALLSQAAMRLRIFSVLSKQVFLWWEPCLRVKGAHLLLIFQIRGRSRISEPIARS